MPHNESSLLHVVSFFSYRSGWDLSSNLRDYISLVQSIALKQPLLFEQLFFVHKAEQMFLTLFSFRSQSVLVLIN